MENIEAVVSSLAEIDAPGAVSRLRRHAEDIRANVASQNNDRRLQSLALLERFAFRVPGQALEIVDLFLNEGLEKKPEERQEPFPYLGRTHKDVVEKCLDILAQYQLRYGLFDQCLDTLLKFCRFKAGDSTYNNVREKARGLVTSTAQYNLKVIQPDGHGFLGYKFQKLFAAKIEPMIARNDETLFSLSLSIAEELLGTELEGTYWDYEKVTIRFGPAKYHKDLAGLRKRVVDLLFERIVQEKHEQRRLNIVRTLANAMQFPSRGECSAELELMIMEDANRIIAFYGKLDPSQTNPAVLQEIESQIAFRRRLHSGHKGANKAYASKIHAKCGRILTKLRKDPSYKIYRALVGDEIHLSDEKDGFEKLGIQRKKDIRGYVEAVNHKNLSRWIGLLETAAGTHGLKQDYEFENFRLFGELLGKTKPVLAHRMIGLLLKSDSPMPSFLRNIVLGLRQSNKKGLADLCVKDWLKSKNFELVKIIPDTYWAADQPSVARADVKMFAKLAHLPLGKQKREELDLRLLGNLRWVYKADPELSQGLILSILERLPQNRIPFFADQLMVADRGKLIDIREWSIETLEAIVRQFLRAKDISYHEAEVLAIYGERKPLGLVRFFRKRVGIAEREEQAPIQDRYDAIPFEFVGIAEVLRRHVHYRRVVRKVLMEWLVRGSQSLRWEGKRFLHQLSPTLDDVLAAELLALIKTGRKEAVRAALDVLGCYQGSSIIDVLCQEAIKRSRNSRQVKQRVMGALLATGVVTGRHGFRDVYRERLQRMRKWSRDKNRYVRAFAKEYSAALKETIEHEEERVEEQTMRMRKGVE